ncbi:MAG: GHKL domain-containing protein, partial [Gammaproteobacteria bacterium]|nr:GHKL domain-containing protein [Gammaproteobacteria bacterium]
HLLRLAHHHKSLYSLVKVLNVIESWIGDEPLPAERKRKIEQVSQGAARLLEVSVGEQGAVGEEVKALERANQHIAEIIQMQRGVSRPILTANWFRIDEMVTDTLSMIEEALEKRLIELRVEIQPPLEELCLPRNPIIQMLLNLVKNSMESVDEHKLKNPDHQGQIFVQTQQVGQGVQISVRDNGVGVEPERVETIFLFGESSKERGTGFGLHSVATFVNTVGGEIEVQSEGRGRGAIIVVRLPVNMNEQSE